MELRRVILTNRNNKSVSAQAAKDNHITNTLAKQRARNACVTSPRSPRDATQERTRQPSATRQLVGTTAR